MQGVRSCHVALKITEIQISEIDAENTSPASD